MKKSTKKISSLFVAAVMAISALPAASFSAAAATVPEFQFTIRTNASKDARSDTVTISKEDLAGGAYTFSAGGYIVANEQFPESDYINAVNFAWDAVDSAGNSAYKYIHFNNVQDKMTAVDQYTVTLSDGTSFDALYPIHCLAVLDKRSGMYKKANCQQTLLPYACESQDGATLYSDGKGGCYFDRTKYGSTETERVYPEVAYDEATSSAVLTYEGYDKSTGAAMTVTCNL
ncbi:MAG: hypothetical protein ACI4JQ_05885, partial [Ruminococcus sp.]